jgi:hypothetical protein
MPHAPADAPQPPRPSLLAALAQYRDARRVRAHLDAAVAADRARRTAGTDPVDRARGWDTDRDDRHDDRTDGPSDVGWDRDRDLPLVAWALGGWVMALVGLAVGSPWVCLTGMVAHLAAVFAFLLGPRAEN